MTTQSQRVKLSLSTRIGLVLTALAAVLVAALGAIWVQQTRDSIHEEITAATRVAEQWLEVSARELQAYPTDSNRARLLAHIVAVGRIRANALEVIDAHGQRRYLSPPPTYKAGRWAPAWFTALVEPRFAPWRAQAADLTLVLYPDASRSTLDAWDNLCAMTGWAALLLAALFLAARFALKRALCPLGHVMTALDRTGQGHFDTRLPVFPIPELGRLARAFNGMADRLAQAVDDNIQLEAERELSVRVQASLEAERRHIARELHDELAQGITAVRALAGVVAQHGETIPALCRPAESIIVVTGQMQDGVRSILHRLRENPDNEPLCTDEPLRRHVDIWRQNYPDIVLSATFAIGPEPSGTASMHTFLRVVQEGLTNVVRHARATRVDLALRRSPDGGWLELILADNGVGYPGRSPAAGCGLGMAGMRERVRALGGEFAFEAIAGRGARLAVRLPAFATPAAVTAVAAAVTPLEDLRA